MEISLTFESILKVTLVGVASYIFAPAFLILRDLVLWFIVQRVIITKKLKADVTIWADAKGIEDEFIERLKGAQRIDNGEGGVHYQIGGTECSESEYKEMVHEKQRVGEIRVTLQPNINFKEKLISWIFKHYEQTESANPVTENKKRALEANMKLLKKYKTEEAMRAKIIESLKTKK